MQMQRILELWREDRGAALVFVSASLLLLMGMAAFGTDLAWFYLNSARVQRAADASALAGVIWMPGDFTEAEDTALRTALRNGYDNDLAEITVTPEEITDEPNQLRVTISATVDTFFLKALGWRSMDITEIAVAEYIPPLRLGSPENQFGNNCDQDTAPVGTDCGDDFWGNIHGVWTESRMGDAYAPICQSGNSGPGADDLSCTQNTDLYRPGGYLYGIESSGTFDIEFLDLAFHNISNSIETSDQHRTGDRGCEDNGWGRSTSSDCGPTMIVNLYAPDPTPLDLTDNGGPICTAVVPPEAQVAETAPYTWETHAGCMTGISGSGIWVVQVMHQFPGAQVDRSGLNRYSIRTTNGQVFALRDFSIYNNASSGTTDFFLAEVPDYYAGKTLVIEMFDPGEFTPDDPNDTGTLQVMDPNGATWDVYDSGDCEVAVRDTINDPWSVLATHGVGTDCQQSTEPSEFHNRWLKFEIDIPPTYSCNDTVVPSECWWKINYDYPSDAEVNDTTTWRAFIIGNPIHLVG